jgi:hypothetical protein
MEVRMRQWIAVVVALMCLVPGAVAPSEGQTSSLIGGGLTALPTTSIGPDLLRNGGFESVNGALPISWSSGTGVALDQSVKHSGQFSYRGTGNFVSPQQTVNVKKGLYRLSGWIRTQGVGSGAANGVRLQFDQRPAANAWKSTDTIFGTHDWTRFELANLVVTQDSTVTVRLANYNNTTGTVWFDDIRLEEQRGPAVDVFLLHPNFRGMLFDDQPQSMRFDVSVNPPSGDASDYRVSATLKDEVSGQVVATETYPGAANFVAELDGGGMAMGRAYLATFSLQDSAGTTVSTYPAYRVSRAPAAARSQMNIAFDSKNRVLVHGVPRFVLGVYDSQGSYSTHDDAWESQLWSPTGQRRMNGMKINFYLNYWMGEAPADAMKALMTNLQKHGVMYLQTGNCFDDFATGPEFLINGPDSYVTDLNSHDGLGGFYTVDECVATLAPSAFQQYDRLRRLAPDTLTFTTNFGTPELTLWRDSADVLSTDPYPLFGAAPAGGYDHGEVADWTALTRDTVKDARPIMTVLQFFKFTAQGRFPTLAEMRNHAWMAVAEGAKGLWWWSLGANALSAVCSDWCAERTGYMNNLKAVVNELADLEPVLLADDAPGALAGNSNPATIRTKVKLVDGRGYIIAYNATNTTTSATFRWNTAPGTVSVNAERRSLGVSTNSFTDSFGPFAAHVYVITNGGNAGGGSTSGGGGGTTTPGGPSVTFTNVTEGATLSSGFTVKMAGSGGTGGGYTYQLQLDGSLIYTGTSPSMLWNTTTAANGDHELTATVTDSAKQKGSAKRTVNVKNGVATPPPAPGAVALFVTEPLEGKVLSGPTKAIVWVNGAKAGSNVYTLSVGGLTVATMTTADTTAVTIPWTTDNAPAGDQVLTASVRDSGGKTASSTVPITIKHTSTGILTAGFSGPAAGSTVSGTVAIGLTASGGNGPYSYRLALDGTQVATSASYAWNTTKGTNGGHNFVVTVTDSDGRSATATRPFFVSNGGSTPPPPAPKPGTAFNVFITQPDNAQVVRGTSWVVLWAEGTTGSSNIFTLKVDGATVGTYTTPNRGPVTIPWNTKTKPNGNHTLSGSVRDASGKVISTSITVNVRN